MLFLQFYVLLALFLCIETAVGAGSCFGFGAGMSMYEQHLLLLLLFFLLRAADASSGGGACSAICGCCFCNSMCCLSCSCAFKLQLVPVPALGFVRAVGCEQHLLLRLVLLLLPFLLEGC